VVIGAIALVLPQSDKLATSTGNLFGSSDPIVWLLLGGSFILTKFIHEMGHAFSCRRFGGECHEVGIMFLVLFPCPYVDASTAWGFPSKWKRIFVGAAGMIAEIFVAAVAAFVWSMTSNDELVNQLAYNVMLIASVSTVLFNANPLLRYDGYYILSDYLEIPNLQQKSRDYTLGLVRRHIFRVKEQRPLPPVGQRWQLVVFNITSTVYRIFIGFAIMLMVLYQLPDVVKIVGLFMFAGAAATFFVVPIFKLIKYLLTDPELHRKRTRAWLFTGGVTALLVFGFGLVSLPTYVRADAIVEPETRSFVRVQTPGEVSEILVRDGSTVEPGDVLLRLRNDEIELAHRRALAERDAAQINLQRALTAERPEEAALASVAEQELAIYTDRLEEAERRRAELVITAETGGRFVAPGLAAMRGAFLQTGQQIGRIDDAARLEAIAQLDQQQAERLRRQLNATPDAADFVELRLGSRPGLVLHADDIQLSDAASRQVRSQTLTTLGGGDMTPDPRSQDGRGTVESGFELRVTFGNPAANPTDGDAENLDVVTGQRAYVRSRIGEEPLLAQGWRKLLQVVQANSTPGAAGG
jgi:putative peptide zinc metalloprotease protein